ncbi:hypothetical protein AAC387_Pa04g2218 [Persea americana]
MPFNPYVSRVPTQPNVRKPLGFNLVKIRKRQPNRKPNHNRERQITQGTSEETPQIEITNRKEKAKLHMAHPSPITAEGQMLTHGHVLYKNASNGNCKHLRPYFYSLSMDFLPLLPATAWFSMLLIIYHLLITWANKNKSMRPGPPEPEGRRPVIGHLHLFVGPEPLARKLGDMADRYGPTLMLRIGMRRTLVESSWEAGSSKGLRHHQ